MVQAVEVVLPLHVDHLQHDVALDAAQESRVDLRLLRFVFPGRGRPQGLADVVGAQVLQIDQRELLGVEAEELAGVLLDRIEVPLLRVDVRAADGLHLLVDEPLGQRHEIGAGIDLAAVRLGVLVEAYGALEQLPPQRVDVLALLVHDVVVLEQVLPDGEVLRLDLLLGALDGAGHHLVLDGHTLFHAQPLHEPGDAIGPEDAHQVVFQGQIEARRAGVALAARHGRAADCRCAAPRAAPCR